MTGNWARAAATTYAYSIAKPSDCLRILRINEQIYGSEWRIESGRISTDLSELEVRYVYDVTDYTLMDVEFYECLATYIAWDICDYITGSESKKRDLWTDLHGGDGKVGMLPRGRFADATEDSQQALDASTWTDAHRSAPTSVVASTLG